MGLTDVEKRLVENVVDGTLLDLAPDLNSGDIDVQTMSSWDETHQIRAVTVREILRGRHLPMTGPAPRALWVRGAHIVGRIDLEGIRSSIRLELTDCYIPSGLSGDECSLPRLDLRRSFIACTTDDGTEGAVRLFAAHVGGQLNLRGATITNATGPALVADSLIVDGSMLLHGGFTATGAGHLGAVRLHSARIGGQLRMHGATVTNNAGPALAADDLIVDGSAFLDEGFTANGTDESGAVRLPGAHLGGQLRMGGATLTSNTGMAMVADGLTVVEDAFLDQGFTANGTGKSGAVSMLRAHIGGQLVMTGAALTNTTGPALVADGIAVVSDVFLDDGFTADGTAESGAVCIPAAHIGGQLVMSGATLTNTTGPALVADRLTVVADAFFTRGFTANGAGQLGAVRLSNAHIGGRLNVDPTVLVAARAGNIWNVDGLTYEGYPSVGFDTWLTFLREGTANYRPQPYRQMVAAARAAGHDDDARRALIAQREGQVARGDLTPGGKAWARFTKLTLGYGYQPWRALIGIAIALTVALILVFALPDALAHPATGTTPATACSAVEKAQIAIDMTIPLIRTSTGTLCHITNTRTGTLLGAAAIILAFVGWALTALFAAGFTRIIRQP